mmetsp:Transcript_12143/g.33567  ORF Transcript_12143/g.33567 Transcript_12143/m.33567 type:complete len:136 (-) Transcript_12143:24-431(-)
MHKIKYLLVILCSIQIDRAVGGNCATLDEISSMATSINCVCIQARPRLSFEFWGKTRLVRASSKGLRNQVYYSAATEEMLFEAKQQFANLSTISKILETSKIARFHACNTFLSDNENCVVSSSPFENICVGAQIT